MNQHRRPGFLDPRHAICLRPDVAYGGVPSGSRATRELVAGIVLGLICAAVIALLALFALGRLSLPRSPLPTYPPAVVEPRPTPLWPFREEWLTPRPKT
jgi:hypothetical protein